MWQTLIIGVLIIAFSLLLLAIRLFFGKNFVHTHIDGNKALNKKGIHCVQAQDAAAQIENTKAINQHSKND